MLRDHVKAHIDRLPLKELRMRLRAVKEGLGRYHWETIYIQETIDQEVVETRARIDEANGIN